MDDGSSDSGRSCAPKTERSSSAISLAPDSRTRSSGGAEEKIAIELPPLPRAGRYAIKFDLVFEGVDWFEKCGSQTTLKKLWVR